MSPTIPPAVLGLIEQFSRHRDAYLAGRYNETQLRRDYLDPFFEALGWDVHNQKGYSEDYREVIHEDAIKIGGTTKAPDYAFRIGRERKFFVEAKKPSVNIKDDPRPALQLRRYAWTQKLPLSILTDFEEFAIYDCRKPIKANDKAHVGRIDYFTYDQLEDNWEQLYNRFSPEAIMQGAFDKYAVAKKARGTAQVDDVFLDQMEAWRRDLAKHIASRNELSTRQLNHAVQLIIDRIVFLRICEDRGIEQGAALLALTNGEHTYEKLQKLFRAADAKYNSGLFHFEPEPGRTNIDELTPSLTIGDKPLKAIIHTLYGDDCPYAFEYFPAEILGQVYERFLGSVITLSSTGKTAKVEEKPEVRKAGGVYYTPRYIVDYIVQHTVGELLKDRKIEPKGRGKSRKPQLDKPLTVLDPACGSGSFLLGAFDHLLAWHLDYYTNHDPQTWAALSNPPITVRVRKNPDTEQLTMDYSSAGKGDWKLTTAEKKRILLEHVYGVDLDAQAVEVTKLSLLLKVLEGENQETVQLSLISTDRALPDLSNNIKCGNSLIGSDFYANQQMSMFSEDDLYRINAFDWKDEFHTIMQRGGFDAVIGNPPYVSYYSRESIKPSAEEETYLSNKYAKAVGGRLNTFLMFLAAGSHVWKCGNGWMGMIVPDTLATNESYGTTRRYLTERGLTQAKKLDFPVFDGPTVRTVIPIVGISEEASIQFTAYDSKEDWNASNQDINSLNRDEVLRRPSASWPYGGQAAESLLEKFRSNNIILNDLLETKDGVNPGPRNFRDQILDPSPPKAKTWRPVIEGTQVQRYRVLPAQRTIDYDLNLLTKELKKQGASFRKPSIFNAPKLVNRQTADRPVFALDTLGLCSLNSVHNSRARDGTSATLLFTLGVLNSRAMQFYYQKQSQETRKVFPQVHISTLRQLPLPIQRGHNDTGKRTEPLFKMVKDLLECIDRVQNKSGQEQKVLSRRIAALDREIDQHVYALYGLTDDEIALVEEATEN